MKKSAIIILVLSVCYPISSFCQGSYNNASAPDSLQTLTSDSKYSFYIDPFQSTLVDPSDNPAVVLGIISDGGHLTTENLLYFAKLTDDKSAIDLTGIMAELRNKTASVIYEKCSIFIGRALEEPFYTWDRSIKPKTDIHAFLSIESLQKILRALDRNQNAGIMYELITLDGQALRAVLIPEQ